MHQAMTQMNLQSQHVISDITGTTGLAIVDAILAGQRDAKELAALRDPRIKVGAEVIEKCLCGNSRDEHLFTLESSRKFHRFYQEQIAACEVNIERLLQQFDARVDPSRSLCRWTASGIAAQPSVAKSSAARKTSSISEPKPIS
jgi:hypothetical protein